MPTYASLSTMLASMITTTHSFHVWPSILSGNCTTKSPNAYKCGDVINCWHLCPLLNSQRPEQNFAGIFKLILSNEKFYVLIQISLKIVPGNPIDNKSLNLVIFGSKCTPSHHLINQWWLNCMPYAVMSPQGVNKVGVNIVTCYTWL